MNESISHQVIQGTLKINILVQNVTYNFNFLRSLEFYRIQITYSFKVRHKTTAKNIFSFCFIKKIPLDQLKTLKLSTIGWHYIWVYR